MAFIAGSPTKWTEDMTDTVVVYKASSINNYGAKTISASGTSFACRVVSNINIKRDDQGVEITEPGTLYILSDADIEIGDRIDLPGTAPEPRIVEVRKVKYSAAGTTTVHHTKVRFGAISG
jgi:hypothetical protein